MSLFKELYHIDVNKNTEKVDNLTYLSWAWAWAEVKKADPDATYEIIEFPMMSKDFQPIPGVTVPFLKTPEGYFVKVSVTIKGLTLTETLPVMNNKNVPLGTQAPTWVRPQGGGKAKQEYVQMPMPTTFDINKSHKRCLAKAIALHGLGLYIYAGEDVPEVDQEALKKQQEQEEEERKNFIGMIKQLSDSRTELATKLSGLEHAVKRPVEKFTYKEAARAYEVLNELLAQLEAAASK